MLLLILHMQTQNSVSMLFTREHEIIDVLGTPRRNHIRFPGDGNDIENATVTNVSSAAPAPSIQ